MNIRLLSHDDTNIFRALLIEAVHESPSAFDESIIEITEKSFAEFADELSSHECGDFVLGAFDEANHLMGIVGFYRTAHGKKSHKGTLWGMYVTPANRQQGVGCALITSAIQRAKQVSGVLQLNLSVVKSNEPAKRLYESQGFQIYGVEQNAIHVDGTYLDEELMYLSLSQEPL